MLGKLTPQNTGFNAVYTVPTGKTGAVIMTHLLNKSVNGIAQASLAVTSSSQLSVASIAVATSGSGFTSIPMISLSNQANSSGVGATAIVSSMKLTTIGTPNGTGTGYKVGDSLTVVGGSWTVAASLTVATVSAAGGITSAAIGNGGVYSVLPTGTSVTCTGGSGTGFTIPVANLQYGVVAVTVTNGGYNYASIPVVSLTGAGTGASLTPTMVRASPQPTDLVLLNQPLAPSTPYQLTGLVLNTGDTLFVQTNRIDSLNCVVSGYETV